MNELREEALRMVAELTGYSIGYTKMQIGTKGHFVTLETAAVSMAERALKAEAANREQKAEIILLREEAAENARIIGMSGSREAAKDAEIERLKVAGGLSCELHGCASLNCTTSRFLADAEKLIAEIASLRASVGEKWIAYSESKPAYGETVEVLFSGPEIALCHWEQEELAEDDMREPEDILWDENGDQERSVMGIFWRKFAPPTVPGEEK